MSGPDTIASEDAPGGDFDPRVLLRLFWRHKWLILAVLLATTTLVAFWTMRQPKIYGATCTIEYDPNPPRPLGNSVQDVADPVGNYWSTREFFDTQNRIIGSRVIAERVVRRLGLHADRSFFGVPDDVPFEPRSIPETAMALQGRVAVEPIADTRIVKINVEDVDPERAATLANAVADAYLEKTMEDRMGSTVDALQWLGNQLDNLRTELEQSELALHEFKEEHNILSVSLEDRQNLVASDIQAFNTALTAATTRRIELSARLARVSAVNREDPLEASAVLSGNGESNQLRTQLREKIAEREGLAQRYGPAHPEMQRVDAEIAQLTEQLRAEVSAIIAGAEADVAEVRRIESGVRAALDHAHTAGLELNLREIEYQRLNRQRENNAKLYELVLQRATETDLTRMLRTTHVRVVDPALVPHGAIRPNVITNVAGGSLAGLLLGLVFAWLLGQMDRRVKAVADVEALGLTVLGILPRIAAEIRAPQGGKRRGGLRTVTPVKEPDLVAHSHPRSAAAECCRTLRTNLTFMSAAAPIRAFVVTSANPREGKTTVATNLAISIAQNGKSVLLVDTDLRRPRIHKAFGVPNSKGATTVLVHEAELADAVLETPVPGLDLLPCGPLPPNPAELLHGQGFEALLEAALAKYDRVIFDSPPLGAVTDAAVLAPQLDGVVLVIRADQTTRDAVSASLRQLRDVSAHLLGGVVNDVDLDSRAYGYGGYGGYYQYYRHDGYYGSDQETDERPHEAAE